MEKSGNGGGGGSAPTGCYKCGRPGHWSRDCPSNPNSTDKPNSNTTTAYASKSGADAGTGSVSGAGASASKPKKVPRSMPKLTPDILLSDKGLGYVLRHFPRAFKYRGRGHEVADLGTLLGLYAEWHSGLLPYYSFDQFIHKVERLGGSKRVKLCMKGLRDRVADGVDPAKLYEPQEQEQETNQQELKDSEQPDYAEDTTQNPNPKDFQEIMLNDVWDKAIGVHINALGTIGDETLILTTKIGPNSPITSREPSQLSPQKFVAADTSSAEKEVNQAPDNVALSSIQISEKQRARMEANKLKALQRAAARTSHIKST